MGKEYIIKCGEEFFSKFREIPRMTPDPAEAKKFKTRRTAKTVAGYLEAVRGFKTKIILKYPV